MDSVLADGARQLFADNLFETVRKCYHEENKEHLQKQLRIAKEYLTEGQKEWLAEHGYDVT